MEPTSEIAKLLPCLAPLAPENTDLSRFLAEGDRERLLQNWSCLETLGFTIEVRPRCLRVQNGNAGFETVIHFSGSDDLGELRLLFRKLRTRFGGWRDRWMPGVFRAGPAVTDAYEALREVVGSCQRLREQVRTGV